MDIFDAIDDDDIVAIQQLVNDVDQLGVEEETPLLRACQNGNISIVELLINHGADINKADNYGFTPIEVAINEGNIQIAQLLVRKGVNVFVSRDGFTLMHSSATLGNVEIAQILFEKGVSIDGVDSIGRTPLHWAAQEGNYMFIKWLLDRNANAEATDDNGQTPLLVAIGEGYLRIVKLLIEFGVDINRITDEGAPLHRAFAYNRTKIIELLLEHGADLYITDIDGNCPLYYAIEHNYINIVKKYIGLYKGRVLDPCIMKMKKASRNRKIHELLTELIGYGGPHSSTVNPPGS